MYTYDIWLKFNSNLSFDCNGDEGHAVSVKRVDLWIVVITKSMYFCTLNVKRRKKPDIQPEV